MDPAKTHHIANRFGLEMTVSVTESNQAPVGTVVMVHGVSSSSQRPLWLETTQTCLDAGYRVVRYDASHSLGASAGDPGQCTASSLYADLEDVTAWLKTAGYLQDEVILMGHSLGSLVAGLYAANHEGRITKLVLASSVTDGSKSFEYAYTTTDLDEWQRRGYLERGSSGSFHRLRWSHYNDRCAYTLLDKIEAFTMPILLVSGTEDEDRPGTDEFVMAMQAKGLRSKVLDLVGAGHSIREPQHLAELKQKLRRFLSS